VRVRLGVLALAAMALLPLAGCGGGVIRTVGDLPPAPSGRGFLRVECQPVHAEIFVDDQFHGEIARYRDGVIPLTVGPHRVAIKARRHYSWYGVVEISTRPVHLAVTLVEEISEAGGPPPDR
jgi:hypothetical protein